jgi:hypothetical protein
MEEEEWGPEPEPVNLKKILMELGNALVLEHRYHPGHTGESAKHTGHILALTNWINSSPEAQVVLEEMGIEWPMPEGP